MADDDQYDETDCLTILPGIPAVETLADHNAGLPEEYKAIRKYLKRYVQIYIDNDRILKGTLQSVGANLDFVLSSCTDVPYEGAVRFLGVVEVPGRYMQFIAFVPRLSASPSHPANIENPPKPQ